MLILRFLKGVIKLTISELWTCVKVMQWMERVYKITRTEGVCFLASVELFLIEVNLLLQYLFILVKVYFLESKNHKDSDYDPLQVSPMPSPTSFFFLRLSCQTPVGALEAFDRLSF